MENLPNLLWEFENRLSSSTTSVRQFVNEIGDPIGDDGLLELVGVFAEHRFKNGDFDLASELKEEFPDLKPRQIDETLSVALGNFVTMHCPVSSLLGPLPAQHEHFMFEREIGRGGTGVVYEAKDLRLQRRVAIKVPFATQCNILKEAKTLSRLQHSNIAAIYHCGELDPLKFVVMEYIDGEPLKAFCRTPPTLSAQRVVAIMIRVLDALIASHARGIVHLDLTPSNIIVCDDWPIVIDFGLASSVIEIRRSLTGTPNYMAPELYLEQSNESPILCDIFSLGVVLYELLTGAKPYGKELPSPDRPPRPCGSISGIEVDPELEKICLKALAAAPEKRYPTAIAFQSALKRWLGHSKGDAIDTAESDILPVDSQQHSRRKPMQFAFWGASISTCVTLFCAFWVYSLFGSTNHDSQPFAEVQHWQVQGYRENVADGSIFPVGMIGEDEFVVRQEDYLKAIFNLESPAYCQFVAANPDGSLQFLHQSKSATKTFVYPEYEDAFFHLTNGPGQQVLMVVATQQPIARWKDWGNSPPPALDNWDAANSIPGVWQFEDGALKRVQAEIAERGDEVIKRHPNSIQRLAKRLADETDGEIYAIAFRVR